MFIKDSRMKETTEVLNNIKTIKLNAWSELFEERIANIRNEELLYIWKKLIMQAMNYVMVTISVPFLVLVVFFTAIAFSTPLTLPIAFSALTVVTQIRQPAK